MGLAKERNHVMLAEAVHLDVFDDDHFLHALSKNCAANNFHRVVALSLGQKLHRLGNSLGGLE